MTQDLNSGIENIEYNVLNLPKLITFANGGTIRYTYSATGRKLRGEYLKAGRQSPATVLEHEFDHAVDNAKNHKIHDERRNQKDKQYDNKEERRVITGSERKTAKANGESLRYNHKGKPYVTVSPISVKPKYQKQ